MDIEGLEARQLLTASLSGGQLSVTGNAGNFNDSIVIAQSGSSLSVNINGQVSNFQTAQVTKIVVNAGDGNDTILLRDTNGGSIVSIASFLKGGTGDDSIVGGNGNDTIQGQDGNDTLKGNGGDDLIDGGTGADRMDGNDGFDTADYSTRTANLNITIDDQANDGELNEGDNVGSTIEYVVGGSGNDSITGSAGANYLIGGAGLDTIRGGAGNDTLSGGDTGDKLYGEAGNDYMFAKDGIVELVDGGADTDFAQVDTGETATNLASTPKQLRRFLVAASNDGDLDDTFGDGGKVTTDFGFSADISGAAASLPNGQYLIGGLVNGNTAVAKFNSDGSLDQDFGNRGFAVVDALGDGHSESEEVTGVGVQSDGKIIVTGSAGGDMMAVRFTSDGFLDNDEVHGFGDNGNGIEFIDFDGTESGNAMVIRPNDKILIAGATGGNMLVVQLEADGGLDDSFGNGGERVVSFDEGSSAANGIALQDDGKAVLAGYVEGDDDELAFAVARVNVDGSIDNGNVEEDQTPGDSFGTDGRVVTAFPAGDATAHGVAIDSHGRIVVVGAAYDGNQTDFAAVRYTSTGGLDSTFGAGGRVLVPLGSYSAGSSVLIGAGDKVIIGGTSYPDAEFAVPSVVVLNDNGTPDTSFSGDGADASAGDAFHGYGVAVIRGDEGNFILVANDITTQDFAAIDYSLDGSLVDDFGFNGISIVSSAGNVDHGNAVAIRPDGKIYVVGESRGDDADFAIARYNVDGSLDQSFGDNGKVTTNFGQVEATFITNGGRIGAADDEPLFFNTDDFANAVYIQPDGKILVAGGSNSQFAVARYNPDGTLDATFGEDGDGLETLNLNDGSAVFFGAAQAVTVDNAGRIVLGGYAAVGESSYYEVARLNPDGTPDTGFGIQGLERLSGDSGSNRQINAIAVDASDRIYAAGTTGSDMVVMRLLNDGSPDTSFGASFTPGTGFVTTDFFEGYDSANAMILGNDHILLAGQAGHSDGGSGVALWQLTIDGLPDNSFGDDLGNGRVVEDFGGASVAHAAARTQSGKIVIAGDSFDDGESQFLVARFNADGTLDDSFGDDGSVLTSFGGDRDGANGVAIQTDGKIVAAGSTLADESEVGDFAVARYFVNTGPQFGDILVDIDNTPITAADRRRVIDNAPSYIGIALGTEIVNGILTIDGTNVSNDIEVSFNSATGRIVVVGDGVTQEYAFAEVTGIVINGYNGDDFISVDSSISLPVTVHGGNGNDSIFGGAGDDQLYGDNDNDLIDGGAGADSMYGGNNDDTFMNADGESDFIDGGMGDDNAQADPRPATGDFDTYVGVETIGGVAQNIVQQVAGAAAAAPLIQAPQAQVKAAVIGMNYIVTNVNDAGAGSLRDAITQANAHAGTDTITFDISGADAKIQLAAALPALTDSVVVDGSGQFTSHLTRVEVDGSVIPGNADGLTVEGGSTTIRGLVIEHFHGSGIVLDSSDNSVLGNRIGTDASGTADQGNDYDGVDIISGTNNRIGSTTLGDANLISGNGGNGVEVGANAGAAIIDGNLIGSTVSGGASLGNGNDGILAGNSGGVSILHNTIVANGNNGIEIYSAAVLQQAHVLSPAPDFIDNNFVGTNAGGAPGLGNGADGLLIVDTSITVNVVASGLASGNAFSHNAGYGIHLSGHKVANITIQRNYIGDIPGSTGLGNALDGIAITDGAHDNLVGGDNSSDGNVIAGNAGAGVRVGNDFNDDTTVGNRILSNNIHDNLGQRIDLGGDGATPNDGGDTDTGPNDGINFPVIDSVGVAGGSVLVTGHYDGPANAPVTIQLFRKAPGSDELVYLTSIEVTTLANGHADFTIAFSALINEGDQVLSTATTSLDGTSEFSAPVTAVVSGPQQTPYHGVPFVPPITIQAEDFDLGGEGVAYHDTESQNLGGKYRPSEAPDIEATTDAGGGFDVGYVKGGEWLEYSASIPTAGDYQLEIRVASAGQGGKFHVEFNGVDKTGQLVINNTGGWQKFISLLVTVHLDAGPNVIRLAMDTNGATGFTGNFNYLRLTLPGSASPFSGSPAPIPGLIEAENFDNGGEGAGYHDTDSINDGGKYRTTGVDIEAATDTGGGYDVGWTRAGEWLQYTTTVATAGQYKVEFRVAADGKGGKFHAEFNGVDKTGQIQIDNTGGWQCWTTVSAIVNLDAGQNILRLVMDSNGAAGFTGNFNWIKISPAASSPFSGTPINVPSDRVQAENFDNGGEGVAYHDIEAANLGGQYRTAEAPDIQATSDAGGGYNVGWTKAGEYLNYTVNVAAAGNYTFNLRFASAGLGGKFHLEFANGNQTGQVQVGDTGGWQTWTTLTTGQVALDAGVQVVKIVFDSNGSTGFVGNVNWFTLTQV